LIISEHCARLGPCAMLLGVTCVVVIAGMAVVFRRRKNALLLLQSCCTRFLTGLKRASDKRR
jgi:hypothetical protein